MKKLMGIFVVALFLSGCAPEIGSEDWCADMKEKPKADWTATEAKDFTKHCIF
jgi:PBP1b-binding outer membrane lipoprotein LpoB